MAVRPRLGVGVIAACGLACGDDGVATPVATDTSTSTGAPMTTLGSSEADATAGPTVTTGSGSSGDAATESTSGTASGSDGSGSASSTGSGSDTGSSSSSSDSGASMGSTSESETSTSTSSTTSDTGTTGGTGSSTSDGATTCAGSESDSGCSVECTAACIDVDLASALGPSSGDTTLLCDDLDPPCVAGVGGHDAGHLFVAPADGFYAIDTIGTAWDTVVSAHAVDCAGSVLGCNDDLALGVVQSRMSIYLTAGQEAIVAVDGWDDTQLGPYTLDIEGTFETCVDEDAGNASPVVVMGTTEGELDKLTPTCVPDSGPEIIVRWVAPTGGPVRFQTAGSTFDTVLYVFAGECTGIPIQCNDDASPIDTTSELLFTPGAGTVLTIVVDGFDDTEYGDYVLAIEPL